jgi:hypothetical protein
MPTPNEVRHFIETIPKLAKSLEYEKVVELCNIHFPQIPFVTIDFTNEKFFFRQKEFGGINVIYRGRKMENKDDEPYENISNISYIQEKDLDCIKNFGRVNKIGESMFYGALNSTTACVETITKGVDFRDSGDVMVVVGTWKFDSTLKLAEMPYSEKYWKLYTEATKIKSEEITENFIKERNEEIKLKCKNSLSYEILTLFGDAFANFEITQDSDYYLSNYFADRIFSRLPGYKCDNIDGIIYPSVPHSYQELNVVLKPEIVEQKLKFIDATQFWVVHFLETNGGVQFIPVRENIYPDEKGKFQW